MKSKKTYLAVLLSGVLILSGCSTMSKSLKGGMIGGGAGAAVGAGIGALIGKSPASTAIGAGIGTVVGATTGAIIGKKMDKAAAQAAKIEGARVDSIRDANNLKAVRVTFDSGILFSSAKSSLNASSKEALEKFSKILKDNPTMDIAIMGHTDNTGSYDLNQKLSQDRAQSVADYLKTQEVNPLQFKEIVGKNYAEPIGDNSTAAGRQLNRRVEVYMYASEKMIQESEKEAK